MKTTGRLAAAGLGMALTLGLTACGGDGNADENPRALAGATPPAPRRSPSSPTGVPNRLACSKTPPRRTPRRTRTRPSPFRRSRSGTCSRPCAPRARQPDGPTIVGIYDAWLPELVRDGLAAQAPDEIAAEVKSEWPASVVGAASQNGAVYGVPNEVDLYQLNYNKALFDEAGVAEPPADWDGVVKAAEQITALGDDMQGIGFITNWSSGAVHPFLSLLASNGGSFLNEDGTAVGADERPGHRDGRVLPAARRRRPDRPVHVDRERQHDRALPRQLRQRQDRHDHHGQLVGECAA